MGTEAFSQYQFNGFTRLERRILLGGNFRILISEGVRWAAQAGTGLMQEFETLQPGPDGGSSTHFRWNNYFTLKYGRDEGGHAQAAFTIYYQPQFASLGDFRILSENEVQFSLGAGLSWVVVLNIAHDSRPPIGIERLDTQITNRFRFSF
jgi:hypothetical protein